MMQSDDMHELVALYAIDALDADERIAFEAHLASCPTCPSELADYRETAAELAQSLSEDPPATLRASVLSGIADVAQAEPVIDLSVARQRRSRRIAAVAGIAAATIAIAVGIVAFDGSNDDVDDLLALPDAVVVDLEGEAGALQVVWSDELDRVAVIGDGLEEPGAGQAYALWIVLDDGVAPAGLFGVDDGAIRTVLDVPDEAATAWAITIEPVAGSPQPTGDILFSGAV